MRGTLKYIVACTISVLLLSAPGVQANPDEERDVGIEERLGERVPQDVYFLNHEGDSVSIGDLLAGGQPIVLSLVYHRCPMLCSLILDGKVAAMRGVDFEVGESYRAVSLSFDHTESPELAAQARDRYIEKLRGHGNAAGWDFLVGSEESIRQLTDAVGFRFKWDEPSQDFAHGAALIFLSPEGVVTRYLYGITYQQRDFRTSLIEASQGTIGTTLDRILVFCLRYDEGSRSFVPNAWRIMQLGGLLTLLVVGTSIFFLVWRERRRRAASAQHPV